MRPLAARERAIIALLIARRWVSGWGTCTVYRTLLLYHERRTLWAFSDGAYVVCPVPS